MSSSHLLGFDIGGTKCAAVLGRPRGDGSIAVVARQAFATAGAPGPDMPMLSARHLWTALYQERHPAGALADSDWDVIGQAVSAQCDTLDGVADGVIEDPRAWEDGARPSA